jgi:uncharacterized membrane protein
MKFIKEDLNKEKKELKKPSKEGDDGFFINAFKWKVDKKTIKEELNNYNNIDSAKNIAAIFIIFFGGITGLLFNFSSADNWINLIFYAVLALLIYLGLKWAIILIMVIWTIDGVMNIFNHLLLNNSWAVLWTGFWWAMGMKLMWKAFQVEIALKNKIKVKKKNLPKSDEVEKSNKEYHNEKNENYFTGKNQVNYCVKCGQKLKKHNKFCHQCGIKI